MKEWFKKISPFVLLVAAFAVFLAAFLVIQIFVGGLWGVAISVVIVLHCTFYMINIHRWNKKL